MARFNARQKKLMKKKLTSMLRSHLRQACPCMTCTRKEEETCPGCTLKCPCTCKHQKVL